MEKQKLIDARLEDGKLVLFSFSNGQEVGIPFEKLDNFHQAVLGEIKRRSENGAEMSESVTLKKASANFVY